ncbi:hypothetical protein NXC12_CH01154 [Rhizobium etli]|uniref:Uncharacterized protein n=1 Tax=Rhizobium etli TaxID=29449 RepID=A0AAN1BE38_RHIET|nr:hypothetical protein NXC12_CH01154 [Rhizobium etli]
MTGFWAFIVSKEKGPADCEAIVACIAMAGARAPEFEVDQPAIDSLDLPLQDRGYGKRSGFP